MRGYFVSLTKDHSKVFVYELEYDVDTSRVEHQTSGPWEPTVLENHEDHVVLKPTPGYHLRIQKLDNPYFLKYCQTTQCSRNGWMQENESPYTVTRFKNDRMFLVLAEDLSCSPIDVSPSHLEQALVRNASK